MSAEPHMASAPAPAKDHSALNPTSSPSPHHNPTASTSSSAAGPATSATASSNVPGGALTTPSSPGRQTHEQLAQLLAKAYSDIDGLHRELAQTKRRAEQAERVAQRLTAVAEASGPNATPNANGNGNGVIPESVTRIIRELEDRLTHSEMAREEGEGRRRFVMDQWIQVDTYLNQLEVKAQEAKFGFMRVLREGVPVSLSPPQPNLHAPIHGQGLRRPRTPSLEGNYPPSKRSRGNDGHGREPRIAYSDSNIHEYNRHHHHHHPSTSSAGHPAQPPQQPQQQHHVRVIHQPGRPRSTSRSSTSSIDVDEMLLQASTADDSHPHPNGVSNIAGGQLQAQASQHITSGHRSRSGRQSTLRLGEGEMHQHGVQGGVYMTGGGRRGGGGSGSGMEVYPASQSVPRQGSLGVGGVGVGQGSMGGVVGGQQQVYQTHIFAPPVTGAPVKKTKYGSGGSVGADAPSGPTAGAALTPSASASILANSLASSASTAAIGAGAANANSVLSGPNFPPTNEQGQRICRQCGQAGRYKDGKCVEKWGPGPAGPGTVCDRCRKKMKRVERRGTLESQQQLAAAHLASVNVVHAHHGSMGPPVQHQPTQHHTGLTRTDTLPTSTTTSANTTNAKGSSKVSHVRTIMHAPASGTAGSTSATPSKRDREREKEQQAASNVRSRGGGSSAPSSRGAAAATNAGPTTTTNNNGNDNSKMQIDNNVSGESDADADADGDGEGEEGGESIVVPANATLPFKRPGGVTAAAEAEEEEEDVDDLAGGDDSGEGDDADAEAEILEAVDAAEESQ